MIKNIVTDTIFLQLKSEPADESDIEVITDLCDTLKAYSDNCVGMAANMIGVRKTIIAVMIKGVCTIMVNPKIIDTSPQIYDATESCLSLIGTHNAKRHKVITVDYLDENFKPKRRTFRDFEAQVIQHEIDHFSGILI